MSVLMVTSVGELVFDLFVDQCPIACENFLKLCSIKYYHHCLFYNVQPNYLIQSGDPTGTGKGGNSYLGIKEKKSVPKHFQDEINATVKLTKKIGFLGMAHINDVAHTNQSQFFITLRTEDMEHFAKQYTIFGELAEGEETLIAMNELFIDEQGRPYQDIRVLHTYILDDPFPVDDTMIKERQGGDESPTRERPPEERVKPRLPYEAPGTSTTNTTAATGSDGRTEEEIMASIRQKEAKSRAIVLEMTGDIPDADVKPPVEVLFVCKLNPVTRDEDLELIFSRFGKIKQCEIIRDYKTGDSLNYAFIEFEKEDSCIEAYEKMNNVLIDDRRIKVDFSQSVSKLWNRFLLKPRNNNQPKPSNGGTTDEQQPVNKNNSNNNNKDQKDFGKIESKADTSRGGHRHYQDERGSQRHNENSNERKNDRDGSREKQRRDDRIEARHDSPPRQRVRSRDRNHNRYEERRRDSRERTRDSKFIEERKKPNRSRSRDRDQRREANNRDKNYKNEGEQEVRTRGRDREPDYERKNDKNERTRSRDRKVRSSSNDRRKRSYSR